MSPCDRIPNGCFMCECTGELINFAEAKKRASSDDYLFDIEINYDDTTT